jgi:hypothetical protein
MYVDISVSEELLIPSSGLKVEAVCVSETWYLHTSPHGVATQKTIIGTLAVITCVVLGRFHI